MALVAIAERVTTKPMSNKNNTPTAAEFMQGKAFSVPCIQDMMIKFAKLHCEAQTQKIIDDLDDHLSVGVFNTVRNAYPLDNIK